MASQLCALTGLTSGTVGGSSEGMVWALANGMAAAFTVGIALVSVVDTVVLSAAGVSLATAGVRQKGAVPTATRGEPINIGMENGE